MDRSNSLYINSDQFGYNLLRAYKGQLWNMFKTFTFNVARSGEVGGVGYPMWMHMAKRLSLASLIGVEKITFKLSPAQRG